MSRSSAPSTRRAVAAESFQSAAQCIGPVQRGLSLFAITRGQFSMLDAVLHVLAELGPSRISLWTWTVAEYEIRVFTEFLRDKRITGGTLVIDGGARQKNHGLIAEWQASFGAKSVRYVLNHAKIATVEGADGRKVLLRGSMNLNHNPRFEQLDITEGGPDFDLVREIEEGLDILPNKATGAAVFANSKVANAFGKEELALFSGCSVWAK